MAVSWRGACLLLSQRQARHFFALFVLSFARLKLNKHLSVLALRSHMCSVYSDARQCAVSQGKRARLAYCSRVPASDGGKFDVDGCFAPKRQHFL